jgi:hypothetical protein
MRKVFAIGKVIWSATTLVAILTFMGGSALGQTQGKQVEVEGLKQIENPNADFSRWWVPGGKELLQESALFLDCIVFIGIEKYSSLICGSLQWASAVFQRKICHVC